MVDQLLWQGLEISLDEHGFLADPMQWSEQLAPLLAQQFAPPVTLATQHWQVIHLLRRLYFEFDLQPANRQLVKLVKTELGDELGSSIALMQLFGGNPAKTAANIAGLPIPPHCL